MQKSKKLFGFIDWATLTINAGIGFLLSRALEVMYATKRLNVDVVEGLILFLIAFGSGTFVVPYYLVTHGSVDTGGRFHPLPIEIMAVGFGLWGILKLYRGAAKIRNESKANNTESKPPYIQSA